MGIDAGLTEAGQQYAAAYATHYTTKNLRTALGLYKSVISAHPGTREAGYSWSQIQNIVKSVVPEEEFIAVHVDLGVAHCAYADSTD